MNTTYLPLSKETGTLDTENHNPAFVFAPGGNALMGVYQANDTTIDSFLMNRSSGHFAPLFNDFQSRISLLEQKLSNFGERQPKQILLNNLRSSRLSLKQPLSVIFERNESEIVCDCPDIDLYGVGDTEQEAITDFSESLEELYFTLKEEGEKNLTPQFTYIWCFLKKTIKKI